MTARKENLVQSLVFGGITVVMQAVPHFMYRMYGTGGASARQLADLLTFFIGLGLLEAFVFIKTRGGKDTGRKIFFHIAAVAVSGIATVVFDVWFIQKVVGRFAVFLPSGLLHWFMSVFYQWPGRVAASMVLAVVVDILFLGLAVSRERLQQISEEKQNQKRRTAQAAEDAKMDRERGYTLAQAEQFYAECIKNKIKDLSRDADRQRLALLVQSKPEFQVPGVEPADMFQEGREQFEKKSRARQEAKLNEIRTMEQAEEREQKKVAGLSGREKQVYLYERMAASSKRRADSLGDIMYAGHGANATLYTATKEREKDWSIPAGIASGIGGVVPGAVTAAKIEQENRDIRARNDARLSAMAERQLASDEPMYKEIGKYERQAKRYSELAEQSKLKLTDESRPAAELFGALSISEPAVTRSETGSVTVSVTARSMEEYQIGENKAVVDGTLIAELLRKNGEQAGLACLNFPVNGLPGPEKYSKEEELTGICTACRAGEEYTVRLRPKALWLIEK